MKRITAVFFAGVLLAVSVPVASAAPSAPSKATFTLVGTDLNSSKDISSYYFVSCSGVKSAPTELADGTYSLDLSTLGTQKIVVKSGTTTHTVSNCPS